MVKSRSISINLDSHEVLEAVAEKAASLLKEEVKGWVANVVIKYQKGAVVTFTEPENDSDGGVGADVGTESGDAVDRVESNGTTAEVGGSEGVVRAADAGATAVHP